MTIFNSTNNVDYEARTLEIKEISGCVNFFIQRPEQKLGLNIENADIPAVALEAIKASGVEAHFHGSFTHGTEKHLESITANLETYIKARDEAAEREARQVLQRARLAEIAADIERKAAVLAAEAADRDELEQLAESIYEGYTGDDQRSYGRWEDVGSYYRAPWISAARAAREALNKA